MGVISREPQDRHLCIVEDNADNIWVLERALKQVGFAPTHYTSCASGERLFKWITENPSTQLDVIFLDLQIPQEDGYIILEQIRRHPQLQNTTIVAVTASIMPHDVERARTAGFDGFIGKPTDPLRLPAQIQRILAGEVVWEPS